MNQADGCNTCKHKTTRRTKLGVKQQIASCRLYPLKELKPCADYKAKTK